jgi:hypothetical protein
VKILSICELTITHIVGLNPLESDALPGMLYKPIDWWD